MGDWIISGKIIALEPLHIGKGILIGTYQPTLEYIPARALRGMLGNYLYSHNRELFEELGFKTENERVYFKPGVPENCIYAPAVLRVCKNCNKVVKGEECSCGHEAKAMSGWIERIDGIKDGLEIKKWKSKTLINTKCPLQKEWHTSYPKEMIAGKKTPYHVAAIPRGTKFDFRIVVDEKYKENIKEALGDAGIFYGVGGMRSRGYGAVLFEFQNEEPVEKYIEKRKQSIGENAWLVVNTPVILLKDGKKTEVRFGESFKNAVLECGKKLHSPISSMGMEMKERKKIKKELVRGWRIEKGNNIEKGNKLDDFYEAIGSGSAVYCSISPELAACAEVYGVGYMNNIYGDIYFLKEEQK
ncbi:MAG: RAMP superfamily CRISPR-associated protein [Thermoplasmata archaeon]